MKSYPKDDDGSNKKYVEHCIYQEIKNINLRII